MTHEKLDINKVYAFGQNEFIVINSKNPLDYTSIYLDHANDVKKVRDNLYSEEFWPRVRNNLNSIKKKDERQKFIIFGIFSFRED